eukprot:TRINITY_DN6919_c0_g2_i1.p1 TRINITY_DN6919_c0_g2~~TRINITY_DN6919_c0_g2_i1.p1  ORF type:complete len:191 (-),score=23.94 TRINITY_DN6919_c0_g2_i1:143-715(-)
MNAAAEGTVVVPGARISTVDVFAAGSGTYALAPHIYASVVGAVKYATNADGKPVITVGRDARPGAAVPKIGDVVTCKVVRITPQAATMDIVCVGDQALPAPFPGTIRQQDVRAAGDAAEIVKSFRPGDVVRAEVLSLGDARSLYLTTARNELGVIYAVSEAGAPMVPISWKEMACTRTRAIEHRKVAKTS